MGISALRETLGKTGRDSTEVVPRLRVVVVDDDPLVRRMVRDVLRPAGIFVVGESDNGRDALAAVRYYKPDIVLLDVMLPGIDGITALERMVADDQIDAKIVVLSVRGENDLGYLSLRKGAFGYLNKELDLKVLPRVLRDVAEGGAAISRKLTADLARRVRETPETPVGVRPVKSVLTTREWEVADELCAGRSTLEIAETLVLSVETVRTHIKNILRKLRVHSRPEAIAAVERLRAGDPVSRLARNPVARRAGDHVQRFVVEKPAAAADAPKVTAPVH
jgi:two-component system, NarL family, response regulator LiaR